jgi:tetratricopeptide (TPR) repeat protein
MNETPNEKERRIIPRWRNSRISMKSRELTSLKENKRTPAGDNEIPKKVESWNKDKSLINAVELITSAHSQGLYSDSIEAVEYILKNKSKVFPLVTEVAEDILIKLGKTQIPNEEDSNNVIIDPTKIYGQIHIIRNILKNYPLDPLLWTDLAQSYTNLGQFDQAVDSIHVALNLAPNNRFILRSATRLLIHLDQPDKASRLLLANETTKYDPWLLSAEIAASTVEGKVSRLISRGRELLDQDFHPFQLAELASALGTLELLSGSNKKAKKLFQNSLIDPNENVIAQSIWAKRQLNSLDLSKVWDKTPRIYEAQAIRAYFNQEWDLVVTACTSWLKDEPFSSRPAEIGSHAATLTSENYILAELFCRSGLVANPKDPSLLNNLAFALANQGKLEEAEKIINQVDFTNIGNPVKVALNATEGLLRFRQGNILAGKEKYLKAISLANESRLADYELRAAIHYSMEMLRVGLFTKSEAINFPEPDKRITYNPSTNWLFEKLKMISEPNS